jgi:hypothetical protein
MLLTVRNRDIFSAGDWFRIVPRGAWMKAVKIYTKEKKEPERYSNGEKGRQGREEPTDAAKMGWGYMGEEEDCVHAGCRKKDITIPPSDPEPRREYHHDYGGKHNK